MKLGEEEHETSYELSYKETLKALAAVIRGADITEVYSPSRINAMCAEYKLRAGSSLDLTSGWDFTLEEHREAARKKISAESPALIIGSPPCTMFSIMQAMNPTPKWGSDEEKYKYRERMKEATQHLEFCCELYRFHEATGGIYYTSTRGVQDLGK